MTSQADDTDRTSCVFCQIVAGTVPAVVVARNELGIVIRDLHPVAPSHLLVLPVDHIRDATCIEPSDGPVLAAMIGLANEAAEIENLTHRGYRLVMNIGSDAGNSVGHLHLHVIGGRKLRAMA